MNDIIHGVTVVSTGLFSGLMMTLVFLLQRQWMQQQKDEYALCFKQFILVANLYPLLTLIMFVSFIAPVYLALQVGGGTKAVIYGAAGAVFFVGCFVVTVFLNLPLYRRVIAWKSSADYADWKVVRAKFFMLNVIRFGSALVSLVLLLAGK
jgi:uncharacterized membrane protein